MNNGEFLFVALTEGNLSLNLVALIRKFSEIILILWLVPVEQQKSPGVEHDRVRFDRVEANDVAAAAAARVSHCR